MQEIAAILKPNGKLWNAPENNGSYLINYTKAVHFTRGSYIAFGTDAKFGTSGADRTIHVRVCWCGGSTTAADSVGPTIWGTATPYQAVCIPSPNVSKFQLYLGGTGTYTSNQFAQAGRWYDVIMTTNNTNFKKVYIDGALNITNTSTLGYTSREFYLGQLGDNYITDTFNGWMCDFRVYNRILTDTEIAQLAAGTDIRQGLTVHCPMQEGSGTTITDTVAGVTGTFGNTVGGSVPTWSNLPVPPFCTIGTLPTVTNFAGALSAIPVKCSGTVVPTYIQNGTQTKVSVSMWIRNTASVAGFCGKCVFSSDPGNYSLPATGPWVYTSSDILLGRMGNGTNTDNYWLDTTFSNFRNASPPWLVLTMVYDGTLSAGTSRLKVYIGDQNITPAGMSAGALPAVIPNDAASFLTLLTGDPVEYGVDSEYQIQKAKVWAGTALTPPQIHQVLLGGGPTADMDVEFDGSPVNVGNLSGWTLTLAPEATQVNGRTCT